MTYETALGKGIVGEAAWREIAAAWQAKAEAPVNTCDSCKHFGPFRNPLSHGFKPPFGSCSRWVVSYANEDLKENECQVESDEGWGMIVGPKFGCILHEPKE